MHKEIIPVFLILAVVQFEADYFPPAGFIKCQGDHQGFGDDPVILPYFEIGCIYNEKWIVACKGTLLELPDRLVQILTQI